MEIEVVHDIPIDQLRDTVQDAHLNFLLGAGASAPFFSVLGDIENVLTDIAQFEATEVQKAHAKAAVYAQYYQSVVAKNKTLLRREPPADSLVADYARFLQAVNRLLLRRRSSILSKQASIFTTNIDLAIEVAAEELSIELNDGFSGRLAPTFSTSNFGALLSRRTSHYDIVSEIPSLDLIKLHGSVGWRTADDVDHSVRSRILFDVGLTGLDSVEQALAHAEAHLPTAETLGAAELLGRASDVVNPAVEEFIRTYENLAVVNPTKDKFHQTVLNQNYYDLLRIFSNALEKENSVLLVIGFSCRDEHIRELLLRAARANPTLQVLVFAHTPAGVAQLVGEFEGVRVTNRNIKVVAPRPPREGEAEVRYNLATVTETFLEVLIPRPARSSDVAVDVRVALAEPLVNPDD